MGATGVVIKERMGCTWVVLPAAVNAENVRTVEERVVEEHTGQARRLVLDLGDVDFLYSCAMGMLIRLRQRFGDVPDSVVLVNVSPKVRQMLETVNLHKLFKVYATDVEFEISEGDVWEKEVIGTSPRFVVIAQVEQGVCHVVLSGHMTTFNELRDFSDSICSRDIKACVIDMTGVSFVDSMGVSQLIRVVSSLKERGVTTGIFGANESICEMFDFVSLSEYVSLFPSESEAIEAVVSAA